MEWRRTLDRIAELELESAALRQQFYAEEDPYVRDSQIKPSWDGVLDRLGQLRDRADRYEQELDQFVETGRQAGAEPGWLAEGWELEPERRTASNVEKFTVHKTMEPPIVDEVEDRLEVLRPRSPHLEAEIRGCFVHRRVQPLLEVGVASPHFSPRRYRSGAASARNSL